MAKPPELVPSKGEVVGFPAPERPVSANHALLIGRITGALLGTNTPDAAMVPVSIHPFVDDEGTYLDTMRVELTGTDGIARHYLVAVKNVEEEIDTVELRRSLTAMRNHLKE